MMRAARMFFEDRSLGPVLPDGATELQYVVTAGATGIYTPVIPSVGTDFYALAEPTPTTIICLFGTGGSWIGHQTSWQVTSFNGGTGLSVPSGRLSEYAVVNGLIVVNGVASSVNSSIIGKTSNLGYGAFGPNTGSYAWRGKMGRFWAVRDGAVICDMRPCLHNGQYGFVDVIGGQFYAEGRYSEGA